MDNFDLYIYNLYNKCDFKNIFFYTRGKMDKEIQKEEPQLAPKEEPQKEKVEASAKKAPKEKAEESTAGKKESKISRTPTAKKRLLQSKKHELMNRSLKSHVKTAVRSLKENFTSNKDLKKAQEQLNVIYSLMDKGKKKNIFKKNKAARLKSTLTKFLQKTN